MTAPADFDALELFRALGHHEVEYVTVGGVAIQAYGGQRTTQDLDLTVAASRERLLDVLTLPAHFGSFADVRLLESLSDEP